MKTYGYSIWLEPDDELRKKLVKIIKKLSARCKTPLFIPHVTLLGGIEQPESEVLYNTQAIAKRIKPYFVNLTGIVDFEKHWTKALFVRAYETVETLGANRVARTAFAMQEQEQYHPHLSLMYTKDIPIGERRKIGSTLDTSILTCRFSVDKLHLYRTEGATEDWVKIGEFKLAGS